ncbi:MAG: antitoxin VbhA family protein [Pseudomonadales bacterium]|nr:antitoxin VbhA family protein [Pseudomonadales bacterium]
MSMLSPEEYAKRLAAVRYARATSALEGIRPTELLLELQTRFLAGEITIEESIAEARRHYGLPDLPEPLSR